MLRFVLAFGASVPATVCLLILFGVGVAWPVRPASAAVGAETAAVDAPGRLPIPA